VGGVSMPVFVQRPKSITELLVTAAGRHGDRRYLLFPDRHHTFADIIAYASRSQRLYPGDVLGSGTAAGGSGLELDRWVQPGDVVEMEIQGIGVLRNRIGQKGAA